MEDPLVWQLESSCIAREANKLIENSVSTETLPTWTERDRDGMKGRKNDLKDGAKDAEAGGITSATTGPEGTGLGHGHLLLSSQGCRPLGA